MSDCDKKDVEVGVSLWRRTPKHKDSKFKLKFYIQLTVSLVIAIVIGITISRCVPDLCDGGRCSACHFGHDCDEGTTSDAGGRHVDPPADPPQSATALQPATSRPLPETVRAWRKAAWQRDDMFSQITLGDLYARDGSFYDPVEAYVWYFMALRYGHVYNTGAAADLPMDRILDHARDRRDDLFASMSLDQRLEARKRLIYVLSCQGSEGFIALGRLHRDLYDPDSDVCRPPPPDNCWWCVNDSADNGATVTRVWADYDDRVCRAPESSAVVPGNADALMYFLIAQSMGHPLAASYAANQEELIKRRNYGHGDEIIADARERARNWAPPMEFYTGQTRGGTLHSDECLEDSPHSLALLRVGEIPSAKIWHALALQSPVKLHPPYDDRKACDTAVRHFQEYLQDDPTGDLTPEEKVRLIQMGAVDGDVASQIYLGVMYAKGIGVPRNYVRALEWFDKADRQGSGEATYYMGVLFRVGVDGVPHDGDKAARLFTEAALRGYDPSRNLLLDMLTPPYHLHDEDDGEHHHRDHDRRDG